MSSANWLQLALLIGLVVATTPLLGRYMAGVFGADGERAPGDRVFLPVERFVYRLVGVDPEREQRWQTYAYGVLAFSLFSVLSALPDPAGPGLAPAQPDRRRQRARGARLQHRGRASSPTPTGRTTPPRPPSRTSPRWSGLAVQNFVSAAVGIAVAVALIRGLTRRRSATIGNFWVDLTRATTRILLPIAFVFAFVLVSQGVIQNLAWLHRRHDRRGAQPGHPRRAVRQPGVDQGAGHQRRRAAQRQLRPPVREPQRLHEHGRDVPDPGRSRSP